MSFVRHNWIKNRSLKWLMLMPSIRPHYSEPHNSDKQQSLPSLFLFHYHHHPKQFFRLIPIFKYILKRGISNIIIINCSFNVSIILTSSSWLLPFIIIGNIIIFFFFNILIISILSDSYLQCATRTVSFNALMGY